MTMTSEHEATIPSVPWDEFLRGLVWKQGEHTAAIAPTGAGKTTLFRALMPRRHYNVVFGSKLDDPLYHTMIKEDGYRRVESIHEVKPWDDKILLWPRWQKSIPVTVRAHRDVFREAMDVIVGQRAWTVWVDECKYMSEFLKLRTELTFMLEQMRSVKATVICGAQRPVFLPLSVLSNSTHVFMWKSNNRDDARKLSDVGGIDAREIAMQAKILGKHEFIYVGTRGTEARVVRSQVESRK